MMREIDDGLGAVLAALRASDALENTLVLLLSDNGAPDIFGPPAAAGAGGGGEPNFPFRGHKGDLLDGGEGGREGALLDSGRHLLVSVQCCLPVCIFVCLSELVSVCISSPCNPPVPFC